MRHRAGAVTEIGARAGDLISAIGVVLVFVGVLFDLSLRESGAIIRRGIPSEERAIERRNYREDVASVIWRRTLPTFTLSLALTYVLSPLAWNLVSMHTLMLWDFDEMATLVMIIFAVLVLFVFWMAWTNLRLVRIWIESG